MPPDVRLARGAGPLVGPQTSQGRSGRARGPPAPDHRARSPARRAADRPDLAQGVGGGGADARLGIAERADQRRNRPDLVQPSQDQRRFDPHLERRSRATATPRRPRSSPRAPRGPRSRSGSGGRRSASVVGAARRSSGDAWAGGDSRTADFSITDRARIGQSTSVVWMMRHEHVRQSESLSPISGRDRSRRPSPVFSLAYSVDADDAFMFYALRAAAIDTAG